MIGVLKDGAFCLQEFYFSSKFANASSRNVSSGASTSARLEPTETRSICQDYTRALEE